MSDTQKSSKDIKTAPLTASSETEQYIGLQVGKASSVGQVRDRNEDSFFVFDSVLQHHQGADIFGLFIVADGMGGHERGDAASVLAVRTAAKSIVKEVYASFLVDDRTATPINEALLAAVEQANKAVVDQVPDGGTTLVAALVLGNNAYIAHVGDSRAYIFHNKTFRQITEDHSLAKKLEEMGQSTSSASQAQNVLYKAIGQGSTVEADIRMQQLPVGASLLLCSDGLWGMVPDEEIMAILEKASQPQAACDQLIALANENGGRDNITAVLVTNYGFS
jgi:protein phosphatase